MTERISWVRYIGKIDNIFSEPDPETWFNKLQRQAKIVFQQFVLEKTPPRTHEDVRAHDGKTVDLDLNLIPTDGTHGPIWDSHLNCQTYAKRLILHFGLMWPEDIILKSETSPFLVDLSFWVQSNVQGLTELTK
eukprot:TRINITY_DN323_c0_g1_i1.p1 TRINITY_DN323_c0_g1~~TRINITY_DN323_c0_g1_i1.p1  ORF type:complete len:134 (+),score=12.80 TRINITY_DN323_c0_g1_i1:518-919(+)